MNTIENKNTATEIATANSNYITRTFADTLVKFNRTSLRVNSDGKPEMFTETIATQFKGKMTVEQATEKLNKANSGCVIVVESCDYIEEIRGMLVSDFLKYSVPVKRPASQNKEGGEG